MSKILEEVLGTARENVLLQVRNMLPVDEPDQDEKYDWIDEEMPVPMVESFLNDKPILNADNLTALVEKTGVLLMFSDDDWVEPVADYIVEHQQSCEEMWEFVRKHYKY